jgi:hypothetical protein
LPQTRVPQQPPKGTPSQWTEQNNLM